MSIYRCSEPLSLIIEDTESKNTSNEQTMRGDWFQNGPLKGLSCLLCRSGNKLHSHTVYLAKQGMLIQNLSFTLERNQVDNFRHDREKRIKRIDTWAPVYTEIECQTWPEGQSQSEAGLKQMNVPTTLCTQLPGQPPKEVDITDILPLSQ